MLSDVGYRVNYLIINQKKNKFGSCNILYYICKCEGKTTPKFIDISDPPNLLELNALQEHGGLVTRVWNTKSKI